MLMIGGPIFYFRRTARYSEIVVMPVIVSDEVLAMAHLTEAEALKELTLALFKQERLTLAQAARMAGVGRLKFQEWMAERDLTIHYDVEDLRRMLRPFVGLGRIPQNSPASDKINS